MSDYKWLNRQLKERCPFCGNSGTFCTLELELRQYMKDEVGEIRHMITATIYCHGCGANVSSSCIYEDMAVE